MPSATGATSGGNDNNAIVSEVASTKKSVDTGLKILEDQSADVYVGEPATAPENILDTETRLKNIEDKLEALMSLVNKLAGEQAK